MLCNTTHSFTTDGFSIHRHALLISSSSSSSSSSGDLGALDGDDEHCRRVCRVVPGCSSITRSSPTSPRCLLHSTCLSSTASDQQRQLRCVDGATTMLRHDCSKTRPTWHRLSYRLPIEGAMLGVIAARYASECRRVCDMMPGCNSFARQLKRDGTLLCHLKGRCARPGSSEVTLDARDASAPQRSQLMRLKGGRFISHYRSACSDEVLWPLPGLRRSLPPGIPSGLVSLDCMYSRHQWSNASAAFVFSGTDEPAHMIRGYCARVRRPRPDVTDLRWPPYYRHPKEPLIPSIKGTALNAQVRGWQGKDAFGKDEIDGGRLFDRVARTVAGRSYNGKELILLTTNTEGLPLVVNLIANLAQLGHTHVLLLADNENTCNMLTSTSPPACLYSSILRSEYPRGLRAYVSNSVWILWLQRYLYFLRCMRLNLNPLLLDADIVLFHDPYPLLKGPLANYTLFSLCDSSAGYANVNGGVWYAHGAKQDGPMIHLFSEFERRAREVLSKGEAWALSQGGRRGGRNGKGGGGAKAAAGGGGGKGAGSIIRFDSSAGHRVGQPADILVYDQSLINNVLLSAALGYEAHLFTHTHLDLSNTRTPSFWSVPEYEWMTPPTLGTYDTRYPPRYARRERELRSPSGVHEWILQAPPWLFSAESDARVPAVTVRSEDAAADKVNRNARGGIRVKGRKKMAPGRPAAALWGAHPPPSVLVHFVCAAWPGSGGRVMAMQLWGKWYHRDLKVHLGRSADSVSIGEAGSSGKEAMGFDAHSWLRVCGVACAVGRCTGGGKKEDPRENISPCTEWIKWTVWHSSFLEHWANKAARQDAVTASVTSGTPTDAADTSKRSLEEHEKNAIVTVQRQIVVPADLHDAVSRATTSHRSGLIAFQKPLAAADRREYQLYVHLLMSAAMITGRVPVLPLALCARVGEWSDRSRCVYVMHATDGEQWCVQRPPSPCHGKVALPNALEGLTGAEVAHVTLPRLPLVNGTVDVRRFGAALGGDGRAKRVLLLDTSALTSADDVGNLLATPKGWLCTLEHKSCQNAC